MYHRKFGVPRVQQMMPMMTKRFQDVGIVYSMGGKTGNTLDSHRLSAYALKVGGEKLQNALMEELFMNYFSQEKFLGDPQVLQAAADKCQVPDAVTVLSDPSVCMDEVRKDLATYARGVSGVPHFIINEQHHLSGAQPPEAFEDIFEELKRQ